MYEISNDSTNGNFRNEIYDNFIQVPKILYKAKMSEKSLKVMLYIYDKPTSWIFNQSSMAKDKDLGYSIATIKRCIKELKEIGFLRIDVIGQGLFKKYIYVATTPLISQKNSDTAESISSDTAESISSDTTESISSDTAESISSDTTESISSDTAESISSDTHLNNTDLIRIRELKSKFGFSEKTAKYILSKIPTLDYEVAEHVLRKIPDIRKVKYLGAYFVKAYCDVELQIQEGKSVADKFSVLDVDLQLPQDFLQDYYNWME